jgi:hypothetical protein
MAQVSVQPAMEVGDVSKSFRMRGMVNLASFQQLLDAMAGDEADPEVPAGGSSQVDPSQEAEAE